MTIKDSFGVLIQPNDRVMINGWGSNVRLTDVRRTGTVVALGSKRPVIDWDNKTDTPRGNVRADCVGVLRRDGQPGFEGNANR